MTKTGSGTAAAVTWDVAEGLPLIVQDGSSSYITGLGGLQLEQINGTTVYYYHSDQLGSTRAMTDSAGAVQQTYDYDPYGNALSSVGSLENSFRYGGQNYDSESGQYYLRARYYDPNTAQFISKDPATALTHAPYAFVADSPLNGSDPTGLFTWGDLTKWGDQLAPVVSQVAHVTATVCGLASLLVIVDEVTVPCAVVASGVAMGADAYMAWRGINGTTWDDVAMDGLGFGLGLGSLVAEGQVAAAAARYPRNAGAKWEGRCMNGFSKNTPYMRSLRHNADCVESAQVGRELLDQLGVAGIAVYATNTVRQIRSNTGW